MALFIKEKIKSDVVFDNVFRAELRSTSRRDGWEIPFISEIILVSGVRGIQLANNITLPSHKYSAPPSPSLYHPIYLISLWGFTTTTFISAGNTCYDNCLNLLKII